MYYSLLMITPTTIVSSFKDVAELVKKINDIPLYEKIVALQDQVLEVTSDNLLLTAEVTELRAKLEFQKKLTHTYPFYYAEGEAHPYCPTCWEDQRKAMHLEGPLNESKLYRCKKCNSAWTLKR